MVFLRSLFPKIFKLLQTVAPTLATKSALLLFSTPIRYKPPQREERFASFMDRENVPVTFKNEMIYNMAYARGKTITRAFYDDRDKNYFSVYHAGTGPGVLLVHGWSGRAGQFVALAEKLLEEGFSVYAFDAFGHGASPGRQTSMLEFIWQIHVMDRCFGPFRAIIGHSIGGAAAGFAIQEGFSASHLITIGSPATWRFIINDFGSRMGLRDDIRGEVETFTLQFTRRSPEHISLAWAMGQKPVDGLIVHDRNDKEVPYDQALILKNNWTHARFFGTESLGHHRILRDVKVTRYITSYLSERIFTQQGEKTV